MDFFQHVAPKNSAIVPVVVGLMAIVAISGCQTGPSNQAIQSEQMASLLDSRYGPQSSFASVSSEEGAGIAPVVDAELQQFAGPSDESFESEPDTASFLATDSQSISSATSEYQNAQPVEVPVYNGGVIRDSTAAEPTSPYSYPQVNRVPQPFASGNPLRD